MGDNSATSVDQGEASGASEDVEGRRADPCQRHTSQLDAKEDRDQRPLVEAPVINNCVNHAW
jgi:hypothetical protein